ncbi:Zinc finger, CCHC domain-containing protein [Actinomortierella ambigua]|nr:Zinc finger, CCHC domain-containing protein [Actinomortierella ambigua]
MPESLPRVQCTSQERKDAIDTLDQYLLDLEAKLTPSLEHLEMTEDVIDRLDRNVMTYLRTFTPVLDVYGSYLSGLYTPGSDLDLTLTGNTGNLRPDDVVAMLRYYHYESVRISRPMHEFVAQFIDPVTGIQCDLCLNQRLAIQNSLMIGTYVKMEPRLRPLVYALKRIARHFCIEGTRHHISSYAYTMWLITFLKMQDPPILPQLQPPPPPLLTPPEPILDPSSSSSPPSTRAPPLRVDPATLEKTVEVNGRILDRVIIEGHDCTFDDDWLRYRQTQDTSNPINITNATAATTTTTTTTSSATTTPTPSKTPGELLLTFLEQYGFEHDYVHLDLHTRTATLEPRQLGVYPLGKLPSPRLRILDPFLLDRDLGVGARINGAMRIREAFQQSVNAILAKDLELVFGEDDEE